MTAQQIREMTEAFSAFKAANDEAAKELKRQGTVSGEIQAKIEMLNRRLDSIEVAATRKGGFAPTGNAGGVPSEEKAIFLDAIRGRAEAIAEVQRKSLVTGNDPAGGYLAPTDYANEIIKGVTEWSPIRSIARVRSTSKFGLQVPKRTSAAAAAWVAETGTRSETTNPAFGLEEVRVHELYAMTKISKQEMEDTAFDLEVFLREEFSEQFGVAEGVGFVSGNGIGKPEGILTNVNVDYVASGHATEITADGLIGLYYGVKEAYANSGVWAMSRDTLRVIRTLKDGQGRYLWEPSLQIGSPAMILGRPYISAPDMPSIGAGTYPVAFGDFRRAYTVVDRIQIEMTVDPFASKATGMVEISARKRVGGQVVLAEAIKKLKIATS